MVNLENEKNEFDEKDKLQESSQKQPDSHEAPKTEESVHKPHTREPVFEPTSEGLASDGEVFAGATREQAEASMTNAFFEEASDNKTTDKQDTVPPVPPVIPPTRSGGNSGGEPPKKNGGKHFLGYFLTGLIGVIVGGLIIFFAVSGLGDTDTNTSTGSKSTNTGKVEKVSYENSTDITKAVEKVQDAVVSVLNYQSANSLDGSTTSEEEASSGSGVVYKKSNGKAYVVTNNHVVEGANKLEVTFSNGKKSSAKLVGTDEWNDLAVLEISDEHVSTVAEFGNSDSLKVGETAIAIGSPLGTEFSGSVTEGIISGLNRAVPVDTNGDGQEDWEAEVIQTDAAINPGNSGGALINIQGQVIGINSMKISTENVEGIGFAIPSNTVEPIIEQLETNGEVTRPSLGVTLRDVDTIPEQQQKSILKLPDGIDYGAMVQQVVNGSAADKAGLKQYDVIVEMDGQKVTNSMTLRQILYNNDVEIGQKMNIKYYRDGKKQSTTITLEAAKSTQQ
ncbi:S1C family serine protease [Listeria fleischmannii]|uniref:Serine protease n=1 Tax=Listeria fleischmannii FSL S10-1203 TaxID=1265822 RepID=W7E047_9LIST|nr:trypsin-like peptidase domain-containing protein [Listeria fleischmannii]EUJ59882.1 serine protease [Listeria fleischmannii FSL S10-1203]